MNSINEVRERLVQAAGVAAMTGLIIPAELWPEWADRHCWDEGGHGMFFGAVTAGWDWKSEYGYSGIPMPAGWDWRVPVMRPQPAIEWARPTNRRQKAVELLLAKGYRWQDGEWKEPQPAPAIDLEQFRATIERAWKASRAGSEDDLSLGKLLALIDGQANNLNEQLGISEELPPAIDPDRIVPPVWLSEQSGGHFDDMTPGQAWRDGFNECRARTLMMIEQAQQLALIDGQAKCATCGTTIKPHPMTGTICDCASRTA